MTLRHWATTVVVAAMLTFAAAPANGDPAPPPAPSCCACSMTCAQPPPARVRHHTGASDGELEALVATGVALAVVSYAFSTVYAETQPHSVTAVDAIPVVGAAVWSARNPSRDASSAMLFAAGVQAIGILMATATGVELAERRNAVDIGVGAGPDGGGVVMRMRLP
jgi:hypothetical protein